MLKCQFQNEFESSKDTLWCHMKDTALCVKFTILERCLHYLMITPRMYGYTHKRKQTFIFCEHFDLKLQNWIQMNIS